MRNLIFILFGMFSNFAFANANIEVDPLISKCVVTPLVKEKLKTPEKFVTNNNLRVLAGNFQKAKGEKVILVSRLMDKKCIPINGATIKMWQTNSYGDYQYHKYSILDAPKHSKYDINFAGSGMATTNNLGHFSFITIMPGEKEPHFNLIINVPSHKKDYAAKIYLHHIPKNQKAILATHFKKIMLDENLLDNVLLKELPDAEIYMADITLDIDQNYKKY